MLAVSEGNPWGWGSVRVVGLEGAGVALLIAFVTRERTTAEPLVQLRTLAARPMWTANLAVFVVGFSFIVAYALVPLIAGYPKLTGYGLELSATQIALVLVPAALAALAGGLVAGPLARKLGARNLAILGAACAAITYILFIALHRTAAMMTISMVPLGLGLGLSLSAILDLVVISSAAGETGVTIALNNVIRSIGSVLGPQVAIAIVTAAPGLAPGLPAGRGFTHAFVMGAIATAAAIMLIALIPGRRADPVLAAAAVEPSA
jgi:MFS family permease